MRMLSSVSWVRCELERPECRRLLTVVVSFSNVRPRNRELSAGSEAASTPTQLSTIDQYKFVVFVTVAVSVYKGEW
jgi:hypothetical protein